MPVLLALKTQADMIDPLQPSLMYNVNLLEKENIAHSKKACLSRTRIRNNPLKLLYAEILCEAPCVIYSNIGPICMEPVKASCKDGAHVNPFFIVY